MDNVFFKICTHDIIERIILNKMLISGGKVKYLNESKLLDWGKISQ